MSQRANFFNMSMKISSCTNYQKMELQKLHKLTQGRKQLIQKSLHTIQTTFLFG